jgi:hypothetical protein
MGRVLLPLTAVVHILAACGGGDDGSDSPSSKRDAGTLTVYELSDPSFSLGVPKSWTAITREELRETGAVERFSRDNPAVAPLLDGILRSGSPMKFIALDPAVRQGFATNVNVVVEDVPDDMELSDLARSSAADLRTLGVVRGLRTGIVSLPAGEAVKITYRMQLRYGTVTRSVATLQYALIADGKSYVVTYSTLPGLKQRYASAFEDSAQSFRVDD